MTANTTTNKMENITIDVGKYIFACFIPLLHIPSSDTFFLTIAQIFSRLGVPFFFIVAGYYLEQKIRTNPDNKNQIIKAYCLKIAKMFCIWEIIYAPFQLIPYIENAGIMKGVLSWIHVVIMFTPSYLWYLIALIIGVLICSLIKDARVGILLASIVYIIGTLMNSYRPFLIDNQALHAYYSIFITTRNGIFFGFPLVFFGMWLHNLNLSTRKSIIFLSISCIAYIVEVLIVRNMVPPTTDTSMYFTLPFVLIFLVQIFIHYDFCLKNKCLTDNARRLRYSSTVIYVTQYGLIMFMGFMHLPSNYSFIVWISVVCLGTLIAFTTYGTKIQKKLF